MAKQVTVVTTKPAQNVAEYGVRDSVTGEWHAHGIVIPIDIHNLPAEDQQALGAARGVMQRLAEADAAAKGLIDPA